ncbi:MAG: hypothetical protein V9G13_10720 [Marmoricola sp.]
MSVNSSVTVSGVTATANAGGKGGNGQAGGNGGDGGQGRRRRPEAATLAWLVTAPVVVAAAVVPVAVVAAAEPVAPRSLSTTAGTGTADSHRRIARPALAQVPQRALVAGGGSAGAVNGSAALAPEAAPNGADGNVGAAGNAGPSGGTGNIYKIYNNGSGTSHCRLADNNMSKAHPQGWAFGIPPQFCEGDSVALSLASSPAPAGVFHAGL